MAVTGTQLTVIDFTVAGTPATSFATPSITPSSNKLVLAAVSVLDTGAAAAAPTSVTGNGLTWVKVAEEDLANVHIVNTSVWRAMGASPSAGVVTANFGFTAEACVMSVSEHGGVDTGGTNGSAAVRQPTGGEGSSTTAVLITLGAFADTANGCYMAVYAGGLANMTAGSGFTLLGDAFEFAQNGRMTTEWKASNDTSVDGTLSGSSNWNGVALELVAAPPITTKTFPPVGVRRHRPNLWSAR